MNKTEIFNELENSGLDNLEEIKKNKNAFIVKFKYIFDDLEEEGAESYANEEYDGEKRDDSWYEEYYLPYLNDVANDNVEEIIEEISEDQELDYEIVSFELSKENSDYLQFVAVFYKDEHNLDLENLILEI